ncbi:MAG TPA: CSLREA domain-containing protein, partial [Candidatus Limnocylindrales bacterium]|nr:CSLREA domain-containing protein [Candidatus Limnocylindrales bacterium]
MTDRESAPGVVDLERGLASMRLVAIRRLGAIVMGLGLLGSLGVAPVLAASIVVDSLVDTAADDGLCTLREAITAANTDTASGATAGECPAGLGADAIT